MEEVIHFGEREECVGTLHQPNKSRDLGLVLCHGWTGCRLGPHRLLLEAARSFSEAGYTTLRFDYRGRGESQGLTATSTLTTMIEDTNWALGELKEKRKVVIGLCSGAEVALGVTNSQLHGVGLWSVPMIGERKETLRRQKVEKAKQYAKKLIQPQTWKKIIKGQVHTQLVTKAFVDPISDEVKLFREQEQKMLIQNFMEYSGSVLMIHGSSDPAALEAQKNLESFRKRGAPSIEKSLIAGANHNFYSLQWKRALIEKTLDWLYSVEQV